MRTWIMGLAILLTLTACEAVAERATEELIEQAVESSGEDIGDVDIDFDDNGEGSVSIQTDEGSVEVGTDVELPDTMATPVPSGAITRTVFTDGATLSASLTSDQSYEDVVAFYEDWAESFDPPLDASSLDYTVDEGVIKTTTWLGDPANTSVSVSICFDVETGGLDDVCITIFEESS